MKKRIFNLILPVESKITSKKSTGNIHLFINKIPCDAKKLAEPSNAWSYVEEEMQDYPFSRKSQSSPKVIKRSTEQADKLESRKISLALIKISL